MKVIIQLQYSLTDSRVFHDVKNITQSSLHPTQPNPPKIKKNSDPTQPMDGPNPWPTLICQTSVSRCQTLIVVSTHQLDCRLSYHGLTRTRLGDRSFDVAGPRIWNTLPAFTRLTEDFGCFKRLFKAHLFGYSLRMRRLVIFAFRRRLQRLTYLLIKTKAQTWPITNLSGY